MSHKYVFWLLVVLSIFLAPLPSEAQQEKFIAIGIGGTWFPIDWSFFIGSLGLEWKFSRHWSVQTEVGFFPGENRLYFFPTIFVSYYFNFVKKYNLFPYLSMGGVARIYGIYEGEGGITIYGIGPGMKKIIVKDLNKAWAFHLGVFFSRIYLVPWVSIGLELCIF